VGRRHTVSTAVTVHDPPRAVAAVGPHEEVSRMSLLDKMKETAQKGVEKTKEAVSTGQDMLEARKLENQIEERKEALGGIVYAQKTGSPPENADAEIERLVGEIKAAEAELATYDQSTDDDSSGDATAAGDATGAGDAPGA
jgi:hypothetical protein